MQVLPCHAIPPIDRKSLLQFLVTCQQNCCINNYTKVVSISIEIASIDPLIVLQLANLDELSFYFENKGKGEAIAAIGAIDRLKLSGPNNRFEQAQEFINSCLAKTVTIGNTELFTGPHFFCSFSFFAEPLPADYPFSTATVFLPQWQVATKGDRSILVVNLALNSEVNVELVVQQLWQKIDIIQALKTSVNNDVQPEFIQQSEINQEDFKQAVLSALGSINSNSLSKIVIAQAVDVTSRNSFRLFQSLDNLRRLHPDCNIFSISNGKGQNFIGASPERLLSIHNQELTTDALAGSAPRGQTAASDGELAARLLSSEKERHEHQVVIDFITQRLEKLGLVPQILTLQLRRLSNIQHLWTPIRAKVPSNVQPLEIVAELHPTPAVAGAAGDIACTEIRRYENFERGLYAAPLGWIDYRNNSEFIVGIRSALIDGNRARLYAGAGIVAGSNPDRELAEIRLKLQALLKALV